MKKILLTGGGGFIGSHLADALLIDPRVALVRVLDNFSTGYKANLSQHTGNPAFELIEGDIRDFETCLQVCEDIDLVCHQAALGSVPRSIADPLTTHAVNNTGMLNVLHAAKTQGIKRFVYAASSSTYGDHPDLPKKEEKIGKPLSPYAVTKYVNELYASTYMRNYGMEVIGLRYFNVFGPRQSPNGAYAAAIPLFIQHLLQSKQATIYGDGNTSRDFTFVENAVHANLLALFTQNSDVFGEVFNVACGVQTTLNELYNCLKELTGSDVPSVYGPERSGDIRHSLADISKAYQLLGYKPKIQIREGLQKTVEWFHEKLEIT
ncbi:MAG: SDR family oxidoreductase [Saprospiraceae bacterium]|nr:SDR family oxidoreductase [Saprospiraceae bacterium]